MSVNTVPAVRSKRARFQYTAYYGSVRAPLQSMDANMFWNRRARKLMNRNRSGNRNGNRNGNNVSNIGDYQFPRNPISMMEVDRGILSGVLFLQGSCGTYSPNRWVENIGIHHETVEHS